MTEQQIFTVGQVAKICKVAPRTVSKWFDSGRLRGYRIPGSQDRRIPRKYLMEFLETHNLPTDDLQPKETEPETPNPWTLHEGAGVIRYADGRHVAIIGDPEVGPTEEDLANGRVMAAAPDLLAAAEAILDGYRSSKGEVYGEDLHRLEAAVAKAKGGAE